MPSLLPPVIPAGSLAAAGQPVLPAADGLRLRPWRPSDAPVFVSAFADPAIRRWHARSVDSEEEAREMIAGHPGAWEEERRAEWALEDAAGKVVGRAALAGGMGMNLHDGLAEVAYWILPEARGRGIAPRAVEALTTWAFETAGFHRLELAHSVHNTASCRVAEKTAFPLEGTLRSALRHTDGWHDMHLHARVAAAGAGLIPPAS
ncbi:GNAT family N-acetyltransferase [Streptomyces polyrhachis]|uniref:GNAT family N-acetyltransferase n=1 Tax=Streptomyces polyrhachis TaxID=1282885 RepID=A0ABW2GGT2_9ACTN